MHRPGFTPPVRLSNLIETGVAIIKLFRAYLQTEGRTNGRSDFEKSSVGIQTCLQKGTNGKKWTEENISVQCSVPIRSMFLYIWIYSLSD
jgi:hypothetical protein